MILTIGPSYYRRTILDASGKEVRQGTYDNYMDLCEDHLGLTIAEFIDGYTSKWFFKDKMMDHDYMNPKVINLIKALFQAKIQTTLSGDMCGDDLVYTDLHRKYEKSLGKTILPPPWIIVPASVNHTKRALGLPSTCYSHPMRGVYIENNHYPRVRITRKGGMISEKEADTVVQKIINFREAPGVVARIIR